jgi:hypothetical protein
MRLGGGARLNFSGASVSSGMGGAWVSLGIPGTGISYTTN